MAHYEDYESIKLYKKHSKEVKHHIAKDMLKVIGEDAMIEASIWSLVIHCIDNGITREDRREFVLERINKEIDKWL